jgi:hypothetical protein
MMDLVSYWAQIEQEQAWRTNEIRFFDNQASKLDNNEQDKFRRANILLLYAHYEGFCKFVFTLYVNAINSEGLRCIDANHSLAAATLETLFYELRNPEAKATEFKNSAPDDKKLHLFARNKEFVERSADFYQRKVLIPDSFVDTESNLKPIVLRKNLYKLGFPFDGLQSIEGSIHRLLNLRNEIAHGAHGNGVGSKEYEEVRKSTFDVMNAVKRYVMDALSNKTYLRA